MAGREADQEGHQRIVKGEGAVQIEQGNAAA
jgi:hypothetical protein